MLNRNVRINTEHDIAGYFADSFRTGRASIDESVSSIADS